MKYSPTSNLQGSSLVLLRDVCVCSEPILTQNAMNFNRTIYYTNSIQRLISVIFTKATRLSVY